MQTSVFPYPSSRILAQWWQHLRAYKPSSLWIGHCCLHRIEAPVCSQEIRQLDSLGQHFLQALAFEAETSNQDQRARLEARLRLPGASVQRLISMFLGQRLIKATQHQGWELSERGRAALVASSYTICQQRRQVFSFLAQPAHFLPIGECPAQPWEPSEKERFDRSRLERAIQESSQWKQTFHFPSDIDHLEQAHSKVEDSACQTERPAWRQVILDRPERVCLALMTTDHAELLGFAVRIETWELQAEPVLRLPIGARTIWLGKLDVPEPMIVREAWMSWCKQRNISDEEAQACRLSIRGIQLEVQGGERLVHQLRVARSDIFKGEAWLLVGDKSLRIVFSLKLI